MNKIEYMAASLSTGLNVMIDDRVGCLFSMFNMNNDDKRYGVAEYGGSLNWYPKNENVIPILFPISCLTKEIQLSNYNDGKTFIPIVELAKMIIDLPDYNPYCFDTKTSSILQSEKWEFGYNHKGQSFHLFDRESFEFKPFPNQLQLFQQLIAWHINLMDAGEEFIPCTETFNPYK